MSTLSTAKMTSKQYLQMGEDPPGVRFELVNGELTVSPSPTVDHSDIIQNLVEILRPHVRKHRLGRIIVDVDTVFTVNTTRRPDILFVAKNREHIIDKIIYGPPDLCIEVISPSSATTDRVDKLELYREHGVKHYWIIDPHPRMAEAFVLENGSYTLAATGRDDDTVQFPPFPELTIDLAALWPSS